MKSYMRAQTRDSVESIVKNKKQTLSISENIGLEFFTGLRFSSFGGYSDIKTEMEEIVVNVLNKETYMNMGIPVTKGVIIHGPSGCGKSHLVKVVSGEYDIPVITVSAYTLFAKNTPIPIDRMLELASEHKFCIINLEEVDFILGGKTNRNQMERQFIAQLICLFECIETRNMRVLMLLTTTQISNIDPILRRFGRFDRDIKIDLPTSDVKEEILRILFSLVKIDVENIDIKFIAENTPGYSSLDLKLLVNKSVMNCVKRNLTSDIALTPQAEDLQCTLDTCDVDVGIDSTKHLTKMKEIIEIPNITWDEIGALGGVRDELKMALVNPICYSKLFRSFGITKPSGVLLWGPPGCGKTLLAKAIANESQSNFLSIKGPELISKYVGDSEKAIRSIFDKAKRLSPSIIFFDEIDSLCPRRDQDASDYSSRIVNQILTEMDGIEERRGVYIIGATNRPDIIDRAITRPGRLDKLIYVGLPNKEERYEILQRHTSHTPLDSNIDLLYISSDSRCEGFSGADLSSLVREASYIAITRVLGDVNSEHKVRMDDFMGALDKVVCSVSEGDRIMYENLYREFTSRKQNIIS